MTHRRDNNLTEYRHFSDALKAAPVGSMIVSRSFRAGSRTFRYAVVEAGGASPWGPTVTFYRHGCVVLCGADKVCAVSPGFVISVPA